MRPNRQSSTNYQDIFYRRLYQHFHWHPYDNSLLIQLIFPCNRFKKLGVGFLARKIQEISL